MFLILFLYCRLVVFLRNRIYFWLKTSFCQFLTWLLPGLRKMLTSSISNTKWCHGVGESCNFMDSCIISFALADVIANVLGQVCCILADVIAMLPCLW